MEGIKIEPVDKTELVELAQRLVRFPSPQTDLMESEPAVQSFISDCVAPLLAERGLRGRQDRMGNLLIELGPPTTERNAILMTYAMTHPAGAMSTPYSAQVVDSDEGSAIRGRGISEQKGALAAAIVAVDRINRSGALRNRLVFALNSAGETGRHDAADAILAELGYTPKLGIVALGTNNRVTLGNKGRIDIEIVVHGKAVHSSTPWSGVDAIAGARVVLDRLANLKTGGGTHPFLGEATLTPTHIESSPKATHTVQDRVALTFDRRLLPGQDPAVAFDQISAALAEIHGPWRIDVKRGAHTYACEIARDGPLFTALVAARAATGLPPPETLYSHTALDAGFLVSRGCDAAMWGPGRMEQFHSEEERLLVSELVAGAQDYLGFIKSYLC